MSPKAAAKAPSKKEAAPKAESKKNGKAPKAEEAVAAAADGAPAVDPDEAEEEQDAAASRASSAGSAEAALAAAGSTEMSASFKNFRHHPDMENFYRFIYENDLRHEALHIIDGIMVEKLARRQMKGAKATPH